MIRADILTVGLPDLNTVLRLKVPVIVRLGERAMTTAEVLALVPGSIIELPKRAEEPLDLMVNNKQIGVGSAVKIGENFGIRIAMIGDAASRIRALGSGPAPAPAPAPAGAPAEA